MSESDLTRVLGASGSGSPELPPGAIAGEYVICAVLAAGGHGTVYEAEHRVLGRRVAIKVLHSHLATQGEMLQRFVREARIVNQIRHPNIVDVYDFGTLPDGSPYYVMELLGGITLAAALQLHGRFSPARALLYLEPVCGALAAAHKAGVVHRDLKASNIAVVDDGEVPRVKLLDFGIAKLTPADGSSGITVAGQRLGTPFAMAPEQIRGAQVDSRSDIYALGVLLYQLLTGEYPFRSQDDLEVERMHLSMPPPRPSLLAPVTPAVDAVVLRAMEKEQERRFQDIHQFLGALREAVSTAAPESHEPMEARTANAIAVYVELQLDDAAHEDDAALARVADVLDRAERELLDASCLMPLQTGTAVLGVRILSVDPVKSSAERREVLAVANVLHGYANSPEADARVQVLVCLHMDKAVVRSTSAGLEIIGGPIARTADWVVRDTGRLTLTAKAASGLEDTPLR